MITLCPTKKPRTVSLFKSQLINSINSTRSLISPWLCNIRMFQVPGIRKWDVRGRCHSACHRCLMGFGIINFYVDHFQFPGTLLIPSVGTNMVSGLENPLEIDSVLHPYLVFLSRAGCCIGLNLTFNKTLLYV